MDWRERFMEEIYQNEEDIDMLLAEDKNIEPEEAAMINTTSGAGIVARNDGSLQGFADYGLGFRFDKETQTLMVVAPNIHIISKNFQKHETIETKDFKEGNFLEIMKEVEAIERL